MESVKQAEIRQTNPRNPSNKLEIRQTNPKTVKQIIVKRISVKQISAFVKRISIVKRTTIRQTNTSLSNKFAQGFL